MACSTILSGLVFVGHIGRDRRGQSAGGMDILRDRLGHLLGDIGEDHSGALAGEQFGRHAAHPTTCAGDDGHLAVESHPALSRSSCRAAARLRAHAWAAGARQPRSAAADRPLSGSRAPRAVRRGRLRTRAP